MRPDAGEPERERARPLRVRQHALPAARAQPHGAAAGAHALPASVRYLLRPLPLPARRRQQPHHPDWARRGPSLQHDGVVLRPPAVPRLAAVPGIAALRHAEQAAVPARGRERLGQERGAARAGESVERASVRVQHEHDDGCHGDPGLLRADRGVAALFASADGADRRAAGAAVGRAGGELRRVHRWRLLLEASANEQRGRGARIDGECRRVRRRRHTAEACARECSKRHGIERGGRGSARVLAHQLSAAAGGAAGAGQRGGVRHRDGRSAAAL